MVIVDQEHILLSQTQNKADNVRITVNMLVRLCNNSWSGKAI